MLSKTDQTTESKYCIILFLSQDRQRCTTQEPLIEHMLSQMLGMQQTDSVQVSNISGAISPTSDDWWGQGSKGLAIWTHCGITLISHGIFRVHCGVGSGWQVYFAALLLPLQHVMSKQVKPTQVLEFRVLDSLGLGMKRTMLGGRQEEGFYDAGYILFLRSVSL